MIFVTIPGSQIGKGWSPCPELKLVTHSGLHKKISIRPSKFVQLPDENFIRHCIPAHFQVKFKSVHRGAPDPINEAFSKLEWQFPVIQVLLKAWKVISIIQLDPLIASRATSGHHPEVENRMDCEPHARIHASNHFNLCQSPNEWNWPSKIE